MIALHKTTWTDDNWSMWGINVRIVLGHWRIVGRLLPRCWMMMLMGVGVSEVWRGGGLANPGSVPWVIVTVHWPAVTMFGHQAGSWDRERGKQSWYMLIVISICILLPEKWQIIKPGYSLSQFLRSSADLNYLDDEWWEINLWISALKLS